jgi:threonine dehydratase
MRPWKFPALPLKKNNHPAMNNHLSVKSINEAGKRLSGVILKTPLQFSPRLSKETGARVYLKREDMQEVRSYKIRGAYNLIASLTLRERKRGVVCASAGNHAQGVALSCFRLKIKGTIFIPTTTPLQKIGRVRHFGDGWVTIRIAGNNFDEARALAEVYAKKSGAIFVHPFDDYRVMSGQGTIGKEIIDGLNGNVDVVICPIGGGGLVAGAGTYLKSALPHLKLVGTEPYGAAGMNKSLEHGKVVTLEHLDPFVDGAAVRTIGKKTFAIAKKIINEIVTVPEGAVCSAMIDLYQNEGIVAEPAGALAVAALPFVKNLAGKTVVCVLSGGNNDILRYPEIMERALIWKGLKHYFLVEFAQKPGQLKLLINKTLGPNDDIVRFEYIKKSSKETGPALIGIELAKKDDYKKLIAKLKQNRINFREVLPGDPLIGFLI